MEAEVLLNEAGLRQPTWTGAVPAQVLANSFFAVGGQAGANPYDDDRFARVVDALGHASGDKCTVSVVRRLNVYNKKTSGHDISSEC
jgi:predicted signal transduction protein with EAL and GGDEF domain